MAEQNTLSTLNVTVGNRTITPAYPIVSDAFPKAEDLANDKRLESYMSREIPLESELELKKRERVLTGLRNMVLDWIVQIARKKGYSPDIQRAAGGKLYTSGSYRLGVHEPGADIDTICVTPSICEREDFFGELKETLLAHKDVTNLNSVETAKVPIITFDWEEVNIDLLFARLQQISVPDSIDIDNDQILTNVNVATEKSLNGPRVTNLIAKLVSGTPERYQGFLKVVRCVRKWAKAKGLYSNKMGYLGGVNFNIMVAMICQLYPNASPSNLLRKFFTIYTKWTWPNPVLLTKPFDAKIQGPDYHFLQVWTNPLGNREQMPIITPAYPCMNSSLSVNRKTLQVMHNELVKAHEVVEKIFDKGRGQDDAGSHWAALFEPSDFFINYQHYLTLVVVGSSPSDFQSWKGYIESKLRLLIGDLFAKLPMTKIQLWPKAFDMCCASPTSKLSVAQKTNSCTFFIGFKIDKLRMKGRDLNLEKQIQLFKDAIQQVQIEGTDLLTNYFSLKQLPPVVFEGIYEGGKKEALAKRARLRAEDPERIKRKQEEAAEEAAAAAEEEKEKEKKNEEVLEVEGNEEEDALQSTLDNIGGDERGGKKTREEAEDERRKLMSGEVVLSEDAKDEQCLIKLGIINEVEEGEIDKRVALKVDVPGWRAMGEKKNKKRKRMKINFKSKFKVIKLTPEGRVVDIGDEDFRPSERWKGRVGGFEFKRGIRGVGYYRTGVEPKHPDLAKINMASKG